MLSSKSLRCLAFACLLLPSVGQSHGGVVEEDDLCVINIGYLKAHFKIYVPAVRQHEQFCEDIPVRGESIFVMEYVHEGLSRAEIDFRIIDNVTGKGNFARLDDVRGIRDLDAVTVRYEPAQVVPDVYTLLQNFDENGEYIGIVSATSETDDKVHMAVFPFEVGYTGLGYWPWIAMAIIVLQLNYWLMSRRRARRAAATIALVAATGLLAADAGAADDDGWLSRDGHFVVHFDPDIDPPVINRMHGWSVMITTADGVPVDDAALSVSGGMPLHDHGLPTAPRATALGDDGRYRIEGLRFHMGGEWELDIEIDDGRRLDVVTITLTL